MNQFRLFDIVFDDGNLPAPTPEIEQDRNVAIFDLIEENHIRITAEGKDIPTPGPYALRLSLRDQILHGEFTTQDGTSAGAFSLPMGQFRQVMRDYREICESYHHAVRCLPPAQIEALDTGRREIHRQGSTTLKDALAPAINVDLPTSKRLFSLICAFSVA